MFEAVEHVGCGVCSEPEIDRIEALVESLLGSTFRYASSKGDETGKLEPNHILVTAPYNVQVNRLQQRVGGRARVGTVDRFQGQEAPVAIHSLTASDGDAAPQGLGFLLEPNRLNLAISRARCLSIRWAPSTTAPPPHTPPQTQTPNPLRSAAAAPPHGSGRPAAGR